jgi:hypothetical protein
MGFIVPLLIGLLLLPDPGPSEQQLAEFSRMQKALDQSIYLVDQGGHERLMRLVGATDDVLTLELGPRRFTMKRDEVLRVDRENDRTTDGLLKGLAFGAGMGLLVRGLGGGSSGHVFQAMAVYGGIGYLLDRSNQSRQPLYRAPRPGATITVRVPF